MLFRSHGYDTKKQYSREFRLVDFHFITDNPWTEDHEEEIRFKVRHTDVFQSGKLIYKDGECHIESDTNVQGVAPGQFGVVYDKEAHLCIGSGEIRTAKID